MIKKHVLLILVLFSMGILPFALFSATIDCEEGCDFQITGKSIQALAPSFNFILFLFAASIIIFTFIAAKARFYPVFSERTLEHKPLSKTVHAGLASRAMTDLMSKTHHNYTTKDIDQINGVLKDYLMKVFTLPVSFSLRELKHAMKGSDRMLSQIIMSYMQKLNAVSYAKSMAGEEYQALVKEGVEIIRLTSPLPKGKTGPKRKITVRISHNDTNDLFKLINISYESLARHDLAGAAEIYYKTSLLYETLSQKEKEKTFETLKRLHDEISMREKRLTNE